MKTILCLTDFTPCAANACQSAGHLASKLKTNLFIFNTCIKAPVILAYAGGPWVVDEIIQRESLGKNKLELLQRKLEDNIAKLAPTDYQPMIHTQCGEGSLGINVEEIIDERKVELIVMGARPDSHVDSVLHGSETKDVINHATRPVFIIPQSVELKSIKNVVFATDFNIEDIKALSYLAHLGRKLNFHVELVHVDLLGEKDVVPFEKDIFLSKVFNAGYGNVSYKEVEGKELIKRLTAVCEETNAEVLAIMHHQHSFFIRLFQHSETKQALTYQTIPLLVMPSGMTD